MSTAKTGHHQKDATEDTRGWCVFCCADIERDQPMAQMPDGCKAHSICWEEADREGRRMHMGDSGRTYEEVPPRCPTCEAGAQQLWSLRDPDGNALSTTIAICGGYHRDPGGPRDRHAWILRDGEHPAMDRATLSTRAMDAAEREAALEGAEREERRDRINHELKRVMAQRRADGYDFPLLGCQPECNRVSRPPSADGPSSTGHEHAPTCPNRESDPRRPDGSLHFRPSRAMREAAEKVLSTPPPEPAKAYLTPESKVVLPALTPLQLVHLRWLFGADIPAHNPAGHLAVRITEVHEGGEDLPEVKPLPECKVCESILQLLDIGDASLGKLVGDDWTPEAAEPPKPLWEPEPGPEDRMLITCRSCGHVDPCPTTRRQIDTRDWRCPACGSLQLTFKPVADDDREEDRYHSSPGDWDIMADPEVVERLREQIINPPRDTETRYLPVPAQQLARLRAVADEPIGDLRVGVLLRLIRDLPDPRPRDTVKETPTEETR